MPDPTSNPEEPGQFGQEHRTWSRLVREPSISRLQEFVSNLSDFLARPVTFPQTAPARGIWSNNPQFARAEALSISVHVLLLTLILSPWLPQMISPATQTQPTSLAPLADISAYFRELKREATRSGGGGGGGEHNPLPASKGAVPLLDWNPLALPRVKTPQNPIYAVTPALLGPPEPKTLGPAMDNWGNPISSVLNQSSGPGGDDGIGNGQGHGVGPGSGDGLGRGRDWGIGDGLPGVGEFGYSPVLCEYCPAAQFSDEAVKAKYEGSVWLTLIVTADGQPLDIHVSKGLGMGLDEKAVEAVRKWRFKPSRGPDGKPAAVRAIVEVQFHLY